MLLPNKPILPDKYLADILIRVRRLVYRVLDLDLIQISANLQSAKSCQSVIPYKNLMGKFINVNIKLRKDFRSLEVHKEQCAFLLLKFLKYVEVRFTLSSDACFFRVWK